LAIAADSTAIIRRYPAKLRLVIIKEQQAPPNEQAN
jgi:hypothetical protein